MKLTKYWFLGVMLFVLLVTVGFTKTVLNDLRTSDTQWEYARYSVDRVLSDITSYSWSSPTKHVFITTGTSSDLWQKAGFNFDRNENVLIQHWFTFLGQQGWELIFVEKDSRVPQSTTYWFKRHK